VIEAAWFRLASGATRRPNLAVAVILVREVVTAQTATSRLKTPHPTVVKPAAATEPSTATVAVEMVPRPPGRSMA